MCNCYRACGADFEGTVSMVGGARGLTSEEVKEILSRIKEEHGTEAEYLEMKKNLPSNFPL